MAVKAFKANFLSAETASAVLAMETKAAAFVSIINNELDLIRAAGSRPSYKLIFLLVETASTVFLIAEEAGASNAIINNIPIPC